MGKKVKKSKTVFRLLKYLFTTYKLQIFIVLIVVIREFLLLEKWVSKEINFIERNFIVFIVKQKLIM